MYFQIIYIPTILSFCVLCKKPCISLAYYICLLGMCSKQSGINYDTAPLKENCSSFSAQKTVRQNTCFVSFRAPSVLPLQYMNLLLKQTVTNVNSVSVTFTAENVHNQNVILTQMCTGMMADSSRSSVADTLCSSLNGTGGEEEIKYNYLNFYNGFCLSTHTRFSLN